MEDKKMGRPQKIIRNKFVLDMHERGQTIKNIAEAFNTSISNIMHIIERTNKRKGKVINRLFDISSGV